MKHPVSVIARPALGLTSLTLLVCLSAQADVSTLNESNSTHSWTLPSGTNLFVGAATSPANANSHEGSSSDWTILTNGDLAAAGNLGASVTPNNGDSVDFILNTSVNTLGYDITSLDSYCAWQDSGRDNQNYTVYYATVSAPANFLPLATVSNTTGNPDLSTHTRLTDTTGTVAHNVAIVRYVFNNQENGYTGFRELIALGSPAITTWVNPLVTLNESNSTNVWTLPSGTNLLAGATTSDTPATNEGSSVTYATLTNGALGISSDKTASVTPSNGQVLTYTLNTATNTAGYSITSFDTYCAWPDSGRDDQNFTIQYSTVSAPTLFLSIATVSNHTGSDSSTHTRLSASTDYLATNVGAIRFLFGTPAGQENGFVGYREFIAQGTPVPLNPPLTWTGASGSGGNATWSSSADSNWKRSSDNAPASFNSLSPLTFGTAGTNTNITVAGGGVTAFSLAFTNASTKTYTIGGGGITTPNGITVSGAGSVTLTAANSIAGETAVSNGTLNIGHDNALGTSALLLTGGAVNLASATPVLASLGGTGGTVSLGSATLSVGGANTATAFSGNISGPAGSLVKTGTGTLTLSGTDTYAGTTTVSQGNLVFGKQSALYNNTPASWTSSSLTVNAGATLGFRVGGAGEFTSSDVNTLAALGSPAGGFLTGSFLGLDTSSGDFTHLSPIANPNGGANSLGLSKLGDRSLVLAGTNSYTGVTRVLGGALFASSPAGSSIPGHVTIGNATGGVYLITTADNQFGSGTVLTFANGTHDEKFELRGTTQTVAGLDSAPSNSLAIIQDNEGSSPGGGSSPLGTLVINADTNHSFYGIIRNEAGQIALVKQGLGTQELRNSTTAVGFAYNGTTTIMDGMLLLNLSGNNNGFGSDIGISLSGLLGLDGNFSLDRVVSGAGTVVKQGAGTVSLNNGGNSYNGGTLVTQGTLVLGGGAGEGTGPGQTSSAGEMTPANQISVGGGATLALNGIASLGNSNLLPQFSPSVVVNGGTLAALGNSITFLPNLTLNGATVLVGDGSGAGNFNTSLGLLGTVVVGGTSPTAISTTGTGGNANVSLGTNSQAGTTFQVADATGNAAADLTISSLLRNVQSAPSALTKTGPGTLLLSGVNTYTGGTNLQGGTIAVGDDSALGNGTVSVTGGALDLNGHTVINTASVGASGTVTGAGGLGATSLGGTATPGGSGFGVQSFASLSLATTAQLNLQLGGTVRGSGHDAVTVFAPVALDVTITVTLNGLTPAAGQSFDLIDATGALDVTNFNVATDLVLPALSGGLAWDRSAFASTGVVSIVNGDPLVAFTGSYGLTGADALPGADPDHDGISNAFEYAFGLVPNAANSQAEYRGVASADAGQRLTLAYRRPVGGVAGVTYGVQSKTADLNLADTGWTAALLGTDYTRNIVNNNDGTETVTITFTGAVSSGKKFGRVSVTF